MRVRTGWAAALLVVAALGFTASFRGALVPVLLVAAVAVPFVLVALAGRLRLGPSTAALVVVLVALLTGWLVLRSADVGLADAVPRLLTTPRPAPPGRAVLVAPVLLVVVAAAAVAAFATSTAAGTTEDSRPARGALVAPAIGAAVLYTAAQLLSAGDSDRHGIAAAALVVIAVGGWSQPYLRGGGTLAWRPAAVVPVVGCVAVALGAGLLVGGGDAAFDPREHVRPPTVTLPQASPLTQLRSWIANPDVRILRAKVRGTDRLHLATLDDFTGASWEVDSRYQQLGLVATGDLPAARRSRPARATVSIERLGGVWLPGAGTPTSASLDDLLVEADDGTLARPGRVGPGLVYDVAGRQDAPTSRQLSVAAVPATVPARYLTLPNAPAGFGEYARTVVRGASTPLEEAVALEAAVANDRRLDSSAASGTSYSRLTTFLFGADGLPGAGVGTSEQFAAAFAVLGRAVGLPTRLTVGFDLTGRTDGRTVVVRGKDATVWPEVYLGGAGWVPFAPTPGADESGAGGALRDNVLQRLSERAESAPPVPSVTPTVAPATASPSANAATRSSDAGPGLPWWTTALVVLAVVIVLVSAALAGLRARRTRRHRALGARGAWAEIVDLLVVLGRRPASRDTAPHIADASRDVLGDAAAIVAAAAEREAFAPGAPRATPVWGHVRVIRRRARASVPRRRRALLGLDPRPLLTRRHH